MSGAAPGSGTSGVRNDLRMNNIRIVTDDKPDETGIRWRRTYLGDLLVGAVCADCGKDGAHHLEARRLGGYGLARCGAARTREMRERTP